MGGSFDHFHAGHAQFLLRAAEQADRLLIGITSDALIRHKPYPESLEPMATRWQAVETFCQQHHLNVTLVELTDPYGPTLDDIQVDALWVTYETKPGADLINKVRQERGFQPLPILQCSMIKDEAGGEIHSDRIRAGTIDREGRLWVKTLDHDVTFTSDQRRALAEPQGPIVTPFHNFTPPIAEHTYVVGDNSLETFIENGWPYHLGVFDHKRARQTVTSDVIDQLPVTERVDNPPGSISHHLVAALQKSIATSTLNQHLRVNGEEDLAAVALVLLLPLNHHIFYGQPDQGIVQLTVTETSKARVRAILSQNPNLSQS